MNEVLTNENTELQAHINVLREALEEINNQNISLEKHGVVMTYINNQAIKTLEITPAQSLQEHDNKMIERVVTLLKNWTWGNGIIDMRVDDLIEDVRKLKEDEFPYSANLDVYNSVRFSDGSYGTMIMESKIVKWLCRNRAKDYFDEIMKGK